MFFSLLPDDHLKWLVDFFFQRLLFKFKIYENTYCTLNGHLISEGILNLVSLPTKGAKLNFPHITVNNLFKFSAQCSQQKQKKVDWKMNIF